MNRGKNKALIIGIINLIYILILEFMFMGIWVRGLNVLQNNPFLNKGNWLIFTVYFVEIYAFLNVYGGLKVGHLTRGDVFFSQALALLVSNLIMTIVIILIIGDMYFLGTMINAMIFLMIVDIVVSGVWVMIFDALLKRIYPTKNILLVFEDYGPEIMLTKIQQRKDKYVVKEVISVKDEGLYKKILDYNHVMLYDISAERRNDLMKFCYMNNIEVYMTSKVSDTFVRNAGDILIFDSPLLHMTNKEMNIGKRVSKRIFDLVFSVLMIVITIPFMLIIALLIKVYDGGPIIYKQERCTINGKEFMICKFRSMIEGAEEHGEVRLTTKNDSRITPIGGFLRKTRLDELPQLFNILKGEMSVVGPRPERPGLIEKYEQMIPEFSCRLKMKAGLTGYAQVYGKYSTAPYDKLKMDLMYIQNYSILLDIKIILMTMKIMFIKDRSEGVSE